MHPAEGLGGLPGQQALGRFVTVERVTGEIVGAGITDVLLDARSDGAQIHHVLGLRLGTGEAR
ncbi:hypothetical protein D3C73_1413330 [compost metagenome]